MSEHPGAAAAGMLAGILDGWRRQANPGALDDMTQSPTTYGRTWAMTTLLFADGDAFVLTCACVDPAAASEGRAHG